MKLCTVLAVILTMALALSTPAQARYYQAETGRYLTADPIGLEGGIDPFVYVDNNPVNRVDPEGDQAIPYPVYPPYAPAIPELWPIVAPLIGPAIVLGGYGVVIGGLILMTPTKLACDEEVAASNVIPFRNRLDDFCREESVRCTELCRNAKRDPDRRHFYGGTMDQCILNCLPEECGGEPKRKGYKNKPRQREWKFK